MSRLDDMAYGTNKRDGVVCTFPGCYRMLTTQRFPDHFGKKHLPAGETFRGRHRDEYERSLLDPRTLEDDVDDGPLKTLFVASLTRIAHQLDVLVERVSSLEQQARGPPPASAPEVEPEPVASPQRAETGTPPAETPTPAAEGEPPAPAREPAQERRRTSKTRGNPRRSKRAKPNSASEK